MPMNEQPPWGKKKKPVNPEEYIAAMIQKIKDYFNSRGQQKNMEGGGDRKPSSPAAGITKIILIVLSVFIFNGVYSSFYTIEPGEVGVILRFGEYNRTTQPGLRFKMPYMEDLVKVDVGTVRKEEFGFRTRLPSQKSVFDRRGLEVESLMLTGDKNVINCAWIVQYRVNDPFNFLFKVDNVSQAIRDSSEMVTRRIVGNMDFDYVLSNREVLANKVKEELQEQLTMLEAGVRIVTLQLLDINPPDAVKPAFNEVNEADQDMKRLVNEAEATYNKIIPKARGTAKRIVEEAHGYAAQRINEAMGETNRFLAILKEYENAPEVTRQRMYLEAMQDILPGVDHIFVMSNSQQSPIPFLDLSKRQQVTTPAETATVITN
jgi:membrane protease subunit HflK